MTKEKIESYVKSLRGGIEQKTQEISGIQQQINGLNQRMQQAVADKIATEGALKLAETQLADEEKEEAPPSNIKEFTAERAGKGK